MEKTKPENKNVGVAVDNWKVGRFTRELNKAGFPNLVLIAHAVEADVTIIRVDDVAPARVHDIHVLCVPTATRTSKPELKSMNTKTPATITIDAEIGIVCAFTDGPKGRCTRVKIWADRDAMSAGEPALVDIDFAEPGNIVNWFWTNASTIGRIARTLRAQRADLN